jgi:hypothetical protein
MQQRLAAPGQVAEHLGDAGSQARLPDRCLDRGALYRRERLGHLGRLGDPPFGERCCLGRDVDILAPAQRRDHAWQPVFRQVERRVLQPGEVTGNPSPESDHEEDRQDDGEQADTARQPDLPQQLVADLRTEAGQGQAVLRLGRLELDEERPGG